MREPVNPVPEVDVNKQSLCIKFMYEDEAIEENHSYC
jgi:hypothetical protein